MYVATFYSFKGGVGRSMALANVAVELVRRGKRVLLVDFDLEAPGLDTLTLFKPNNPSLGIAEYVTDYLDATESPDITRYVYRADVIPQTSGQLWIMPAGLADDTYAVRLASINWEDLYTKYEGYLMFEDMKAQWADQFAPDYVLIDSRTGHTDVSGICTRQLPDAVFVFFIPNEQNRRGLEKVVRDIRAEEESPRHKAIELQFVMSNVPDLDDEDEILARLLRSFDKSLGFGSGLSTIHRYDSLTLLNQAVFTHDRPKSRLAREYHQLTDRLVALNPEDKEGALSFLRRASRRGAIVSPQMLESRLEQIRAKHASDAETMAEMARVRLRQGRVLEAAGLLDDVVRLGRNTSDVLLDRATVRHLLGDLDESAEDALSVLSDTQADYTSIERAIAILRLVRPEHLATVADRAGITSRSHQEQVWIASQLHQSRFELMSAREIALRVVADPRAARSDHAAARADLVLIHLGLGEFDRAIALLSTDKEGAITRIADAFNLAMATWAVSGTPSGPLFQRVVDFHTRTPQDRFSANYLQCLAISYWAVGNAEEARTLAQRARSRVMSQRTPEFSAWSYLQVKPEAFVQEIGALLLLIDGLDVRPAFITADMTSAVPTLKERA